MVFNSAASFGLPSYLLPMVFKQMICLELHRLSPCSASPPPPLQWVFCFHHSHETAVLLTHQFLRTSRATLAYSAGAVGTPGNIFPETLDLLASIAQAGSVAPLSLRVSPDSAGLPFCLSSHISTPEGSRLCAQGSEALGSDLQSCLHPTVTALRRSHALGAPHRLLLSLFLCQTPPRPDPPAPGPASQPALTTFPPSSGMSTPAPHFLRFHLCPHRVSRRDIRGQAPEGLLDLCKQNRSGSGS